jgi:hypothetical protein
MGRLVNTLTTIMGLALIPYASWLLYVLERFGSVDFIIVSVTGMFLVWFKDSSAKEVIEKILNYKFSETSSHSTTTTTDKTVTQIPSE